MPTIKIKDWLNTLPDVTSLTAGDLVMLRDAETGQSKRISGENLKADLGESAQALIDAAIAGLVDSSPATLDTLNEIAAALGNDPNFATTVLNQLANKADIYFPPTLTLHTLTDQLYNTTEFTKQAWSNADVVSNDGFGSLPSLFDLYPIPETGLWFIQGYMLMGGTGSTFNYMNIIVNGVQFYLAEHFLGNDHFTFVHRFAQGDSFGVQFITDGSNLKILEKTLHIHKLAR